MCTGKPVKALLMQGKFMLCKPLLLQFIMQANKYSVIIFSFTFCITPYQYVMTEVHILCMTIPSQKTFQ